MKNKGLRLGWKVILTIVLAVGTVIFKGDLALAVGGVEINEQNFPDLKFRDYVSKTFDRDENGILSEAEINEITIVDCSGNHVYNINRGISSLKGIEFFTNLETLSCNCNQLSSLDVSQNSKLTKLECEYNQLESVDISNNEALVTLSIYDNQVKVLDLSNNVALKYLNCSNNKLNSLDVSENAALIQLACADNLLNSLDVGNNHGLTMLYCANNPLTSLDVSKNVALETLRCYGNQLNILDVSKNIELTYLECNNNQLSSLDVTKNVGLNELYCYENLLQTLNVSKNSALKRLKCNDNQLDGLDISNCPSLFYLECGYNHLDHLDVSKNMVLGQLFCQKNQLSDLDVSNNKNLAVLHCYDNQLSQLNINEALSSLYCYDNQLISLDISKSSKLVDAAGRQRKDFRESTYENRYVTGIKVRDDVWQYPGPSSGSWGSVIDGMEVSPALVIDKSVIILTQADDVAISATTTPKEAGIVEGAGAYAKGTEVSVTAKENEGYRFRSWKENGEVISQNAIYSFIASKQRVLEAVYEKMPALNGTVTINGSMKYGESIEAKVTGSNNTGQYSYQWRRDGKYIEDATSSFYKLSKEDIGKLISCEVRSSEQTGFISGTAREKVTKADGPTAPEGLTGVAASETGTKDGRISGVTKAMEWATKKDFSDKKACSGTEVTGLAAGIYYVRIAETDTAKAGSATKVVVEDGEEKVTYQDMYRLYNPNSGEHFYTANPAERDYLDSVGWNYEGLAWSAPETSNTPVYRLYNPNAGDHHYTTSAGERDMLVSVGWNDEGIGWYSDDAQGEPLYRLYNPNATQAGAHHYTTNAAERDMLVSIGWNDEGIGWYGGK